MMAKQKTMKLTLSPGLKKLFDAEKGHAIAAGLPRSFEDMELESLLSDVDTQALRRMIHQFGEEQLKRLVHLVANRHYPDDESTANVSPQLNGVK
jgi:hypothetical protein